MEKELFISTLKEKTGVDNLSERTIDEVASLFLPDFADDASITDDSWKVPVQMVKTMSGQLRHDLSGGINDFKTKFEEESKAAQQKAIADAVAAAKAEWEKEHGGNGGESGSGDSADLDKKIAAAVAKATAEQNKAFETLNKQFGDYMKLVSEREKAQAVTNVRDQIKNYLSAVVLRRMNMPLKSVWRNL